MDKRRKELSQENKYLLYMVNVPEFSVFYQDNGFWGREEMDLYIEKSAGLCYTG